MGSYSGEMSASGGTWHDARMPVHGAALFGLLAGTSYLTRDAFATIWRWLFDLAGMPFAWFAFDILGFAALGAFAWSFAVKRKSPFALYALALLPMSVIVAALTVDSNPAFLGAAVKMIVPLYAGWCLAGLDLPARPRARRFFIAICLATIAGIALDAVTDFPWTGLAVDQFGVSKTVDKVWSIDSVTRVGGFAGESTAAAAIALFAWLMVHRKLAPVSAVSLGLLVAAACFVATSRTALGIAVLATGWIAAEAWLMAGLRSTAAHRSLAMGSFVLVLVPLALVASASALSFAEISSSLTSFEQRIEASWQYPFALLADRSPVSLATGCGLGCLNFPARYSDWANLLQPVDNFYILNFAMFGIFFVPVLAGLVLTAVKEGDRTKLLLIAAVNLYTFFLEGFSPSFTLFTIGYATSGMHLLRIGRSVSGQRAQRRFGDFKPAA
ncbi:hypothetical protein [Croceicoccus gelatinilyticus]|uniref:hypothetical protein n=1 Tax=Croceicoccus gelatinilyticus TaxID=2835536 RepID=UPI001BCDCE99|nr:hypothetical protein [Croceicoccus gelatinilyticus]MBS7668928.1 hypothetical protein [Croceicoccus gelatinilyticus]